MSDQLKIAEIIPVYKKESVKRFSNYRPVSLLLCFSKLLEHLKYNRIDNFLTQCNIITDNQYGFSKQYATYVALINLINRISTNIDERNYNIGYSMTSPKHLPPSTIIIILPKKTQLLWNTKVNLQWFENDLDKRKQFVSYNQTDPEQLSITCGVP